MKALTPLLLVAGLAALVLCSAPPAQAVGDEGPLLPRPALLEGLFAGQVNMVADYYWIRTINQIGAARTPEQYRNAYFLANLTTDLDPKFDSVYRFAGLALPTAVGRGKYANTRESTAILEKGAKNVPTDFKIRFLLAYNLMFFERRPDAAAALLQELSTWQGSPSWLPALVTRLYAQAGNFDASTALAEQLRDSAEDEETRAFYERRLAEIAQEKVLQQIDFALATYQRDRGQPAIDVAALVREGYLQSLPEDPLGGTFVIGPDGRGRSTASEDRLELHEDVKSGAEER